VKRLKLQVLAVATMVTRNANDATVAPTVAYGGVYSLDSGSRFYVRAFCTNVASVAINLFQHLIHFIKK
jgi:hypothetical protein